VHVRFLALPVFLLLLSGGPSLAEQTPAPPIRPNQFPTAPAPPDENQQHIEREMAKRANQERQAELKRDTDHLFKLATELKQYVDKSNENTLSLDVVKKADEIEKLAHSVKEKMKGN
jgi:hypothetical protein